MRIRASRSPTRSSFTLRFLGPLIPYGAIVAHNIYRPEMTQKALDWIATAVLPNVELEVPIEEGKMALVPSSDPRALNACNAHPNLLTFLNSFTDTFGQKLAPSVMMVRKDAPQRVFTIEALAGFRDAISMSVVAYSRASELEMPHGHRINYSDYFWLYPWMVDRRGDYLVANTPAMLAIHDIDKFRGQSSPEIARCELRPSALDQPLLAALLKHWHKRFAVSRSGGWRERALFRSLNMANRAAAVPAGLDTTYYDVGRLIALWVSAFEILAHPGDKKSDLAAVYRLLEDVEWLSKLCGYRRYKAHENRSTSKRRAASDSRRILACWLYGRLYQARNSFIHGNRIKSADLSIRGTDWGLFRYAAPLYRLALTGFLPLTWREPIPSLDNPEAFATAIVENHDFDRYQRSYEDALLTSRGK